MAALTATDYSAIRDELYRFGNGKDELKALPGLPNEAQLKAAFQALEDFWTSNAAALKTSMQTAIGQTITNALAKKISRAWLQNKFKAGG